MGKFDLNPEELKKFDLTPEEMAPKSKYPGPKHVTDEQVGLMGPPLYSNQNYDKKDIEHGYNSDLSPEGDRLFHKENDRKMAEETLKGLGYSFAGAGLGKAVGSALSVKGVTPLAATPVQKAGSKLADLAGSAIQKVADHALQGGVLGYLAGHAAGHGVIGAVAGLLSKPVLNVAAKVAPPVTKAIFDTAVTGAPAAVATSVPALAKGEKTKSTEEAGKEALQGPAPYRGVMSNAIDRLRVAAQSDNRAKELLTRIDAQDFTVPGSVSQGTLGE